MIVRDEEQTLPACLTSVRAIADELIIVDTGSTDRTIEIAELFGARVYSFAWNDDFSTARNYSLQFAQSDWVLVLDADEVLVPEAIPRLRQVMRLKKALLVNLLRQEVGAGQAPFSLISRLFRRHPDIQFCRPYHELVDDSVMAIRQKETHWQIIELPGVAIRHIGYQTRVIAQKQKFDRACRIMEAYLRDHPNDAYLCNKLGALYADQGDLAKALSCLQQGLAADPPEPSIRYELHYHLGGTYSQKQHRSEAETHYRKALEQPIPAPLKLGALSNWGKLLEEQGDWGGARALYQQMVTAAPSYPPAYFNLGLALKQLGDLPGAIAHYRQAIQLNPDFPEAHQNLGVALLKVGQIQESREAFQQAIALYQQQGSPEADRLDQALHDLGLHWQPNPE
jgi:tetratricopeptide (TPR) repeat protein